MLDDLPHAPQYRPVLWPNFAKRGGTIPVVVQAHPSKEIMWVAETDHDSWLQTLATGRTHFLRAGDGGETLVQMLVNCDGAALVYQVESQGFGRSEWSQKAPNFKLRPDGLVTVVTRDSKTLEVLMVAYANDEAWERTCQTGIATYLTTSRGHKLWVKGETSDNRQKVVDMYTHKSGRVVIYSVEPLGRHLACHTDAVSCFYRRILGGKVHDAPLAGEKDYLMMQEATINGDLLARGL